MKIKVEPDKKLKDGVHDGTIVDIRYRHEPYEYTDLILETGDQIQVSAGYPSNIMPSSALGQLLVRFGIKLEVGNEIDPDVLKGKKVSFQTTTKQTEKGKFTKVLLPSVCPR